MSVYRKLISHELVWWESYRSPSTMLLTISTLGQRLRIRNSSRRPSLMSLYSLFSFVNYRNPISPVSSIAGNQFCQFGFVSLVSSITGNQFRQFRFVSFVLSASFRFVEYRNPQYYNYNSHQYISHHTVVNA